MIDWNKPIQLRDGTAARVLGTVDTGCGKLSKVISAQYQHGVGEYVILVREDDEGPVVNKPAVLTRWFNILPATGFKTRAEADAHNLSGERIACLKVTFKEGDGLKGDVERTYAETREAKVLIKDTRELLFGPFPVAFIPNPIEARVFRNLKKLEALL